MRPVEQHNTYSGDTLLALLGDQDAALRLSKKGSLLPCPWCGGENILTSYDSLSSHCECASCCTHGPSVWDGTREEAILAWNTRFPNISAQGDGSPSHLQSENALLRQELAQQYKEVNALSEKLARAERALQDVGAAKASLDRAFIGYVQEDWC